MKFEIKKFDAAGRIGLITHNGKTLITPTILPVVSPFDNVIPPRSLYEEFGAKAIFTNAYILYNNKEKAQIAESKGLHSYLDYDGLIATDSGAFQHYMYGNKNEITAGEIESFQERIQSDFPVILDIPVQLSDSKEIARNKVTQTIQRAKENISRRTSTHGAWYGPIHGTMYPDIIQESCEGMNPLDFGIYAVGGIVKAMNAYAFELCVDAFLTVKKNIRQDRPVHMFGLGLPQFFSLAVATGADLMDSAAYILFAKEGRYFTLEGTRNILDLSELPCSCPVCSNHRASEIASLFKTGKKQKKQHNEGIELLTRHNLHVTFGELRTIRESIRNGSLWELVEQRIQSHPKLIRAYEKIPAYWKEIETLIPIEKKKGQMYKGDVSLSRPVFQRMSSKVMNTYKIPKNTFLLLIPESEETLFNSPNGKEWINSIEHVMKTSDISIEPLVVSTYFGLIPLDLYGIYPFSQRDWAEPHENIADSISFSSIIKYLEINEKNITQIVVYYPPKNQEDQKTNLFIDTIMTELGKKEKLGTLNPVQIIKEIEDLKKILE